MIITFYYYVLLNTIDIQFKIFYFAANESKNRNMFYIHLFISLIKEI